MGNQFKISLILTGSLMKNSRHVPTEAISASVLNYCNLWLSSPSWHQFIIPVQAINVLYKSRLLHAIPSNYEQNTRKTFIK